MSAHVIVKILAMLLAVSGILGCESRAESTGRDQPNRYARRYLPFAPMWVAESRIPSGPPKSPQMVIWEVSEFDPRIPATPEQQKAADDFVKACFDAAVANNWFDQSKGIADGFLTLGADSRHHQKVDFILDGIQLHAERPEYLMYYPNPNRPGEQALAGFMFLADAREARGRQFAGPLAVWHYHKYTNARCWAGRGLYSKGMIDSKGNCSKGGIPLHRSPEMVHVWLIDLPNGPFSTGMTVPQVVLRKGLAKRWEKHGF